ncbi:MAG: cobalt ECF transporter T component CbiQ [Nitrospinota bacterium]|nr:cobalt ECF transporter T component CbiQ [Nitrospinota bacterium]
MLFELFSDIFTIRQSRLASVDARVKVIVALCAVIMTLAASSPLFPTLMLLAAFTGAYMASVPARHVALRFAAPAGTAAFIFLLKALMTPGEVIGSFQIAGIGFAATDEGLRQGVLICARVMGAVGVLLLFSFVTPAHHLFRSLRWMGAPKGWVEVAMLMYRFTFDIFEKAVEVGSAQRTRLGYSTAGRSLSSAGTLAGAVALGAMEKAERVEEAMLVRGYNGEIPYDPPPPLGAYGVLKTSGALLALAALFIILETV